MADVNVESDPDARNPSAVVISVLIDASVIRSRRGSRSAPVGTGVAVFGEAEMVVEGVGALVARTLGSGDTAA